jgi:hypothetical protein
MMSVCNLSLADVAICDDLPADDPMKMVMVKSLMARDIGKNSHLDYIARALTRPWTGLPAIETLRVELLRFKRTFPNAKFSIGMDNHAFLVRVPLYVTPVILSIYYPAFSHMERTTRHQRYRIYL